MPSLPAQLIQRKRVTAALEEALASSCLVVLTAPLGHGKTTAAQQLLSRWKSRSLYLRMKPGWQDNADYLWDETCTQLERQGVPETEALKLIGFPNDDARMFRCMAFFREYLSAAPTLLVIDDLHQVDAPPIDRLFESLVYEEIPGFKILILSRNKPALPLAYLQLNGYATVLDSSLLDFSQDEARQLFDAAGENDHEFADIARDFSNGWAAALRICLQSYLTDSVIRPVRDIEALLSDTFYASYSREDQCLLLQLSVLDTFSPNQAVFITGEKDAPLRLRKLYEQNAFLQYSAAADTYSIHALLRSFLLQRLTENSNPACEAMDMQLLYRRAAECVLQSRDYLQTIRLFAQAGADDDLLRILQLFETPGEGLFLLPAYETVTGIIEGIPWDIRFLSPIGYLGFIHRYAVRVSRAQGGEMMREAEARFLENGALPEEMQRKIRGEVELIRAVVSFNDIKAICRCYEKAEELLQGRSRLVNKNMYWTYNCPHSAFLYLNVPGQYEFLEELVSANLIHFQNVSGGANAGAVELLSAERALETGKLHAAAELLQTAKYRALEGEQHSGLVATNFTLARHQLAAGHTGTIYESLYLIRKQVEQYAHPLLLHNLEVCFGYIASVCNDVERIPSWLLQHEPLIVRNNQAHAFTLIVRGKAIMALKNWPRLQAFAEEIEARITALGSLFGRLHVLLFKSIAAANLQQRNSSFSEKYLMQALELAKPDGIMTSIAEYGGHLYPLLQRLGNLHPEKRDIMQLSRLTKQYAKLGKKQTSKLTLREADIMAMVREGANNKDIGLKFGITQGSVANSLSRIYIKLGVSSRIEAIKKWAEESHN